MDDHTPIDDLIFEMQINLCERFPAMTPLTLRKEKARDVFSLMVRFSDYNRKQKKKEKKQRKSKGKNIIRRPAGDDWF